MGKAPDWESVGCESQYRNFLFFCLISLILNTKLEKHDYFRFCPKTDAIE